MKSQRAVASDTGFLMAKTKEVNGTLSLRGRQGGGEVLRNIHMRFPIIFLTLAIVLTGCGQGSVQLEFVIPDGYIGVLKIREQPSGMATKPINAVVVLPFSTNGLCDVRGKPLQRWHRINPHYSTTGPITWIEFPDQTPTNVVGLRWVGTKHEVAEDWFVIGTYQDQRVAHEKMVGFKWPSERYPGTPAP